MRFSSSDFISSRTADLFVGDILPYFAKVLHFWFLHDRINNKNNIEILYNSKVTKLIGVPLYQIIINESTELLVDGLFISIGLEPNTNIVEKLLDKDDNNYIISDDCLTTKKGIFVAGDCRKKTVRQVTTAVNDGTIAANLAINYLEEIN